MAASAPSPSPSSICLFSFLSSLVRPSIVSIHFLFSPGTLLMLSRIELISPSLPFPSLYGRISSLVPAAMRTSTGGRTRRWIVGPPSNPLMAQIAVPSRLSPLLNFVVQPLRPLSNKHVISLMGMAMPAGLLFIRANANVATYSPSGYNGNSLSAKFDTGEQEWKSYL